MYEENNLDEFAPWMVLLISLVGLGLRVFLLNRNGMGFDETLSVWAASQNLSDLLGWVTRADLHPPLYYLLLHAWIGENGDAPYNVRLLSALLGTGAIPLVYLAGKRLSGAAMGVAAAALLAVSPFNIRFAQEARMYTLLAFNAAAALAALAHLITDPRSAQPIGSQFRAYLQAWRTPGALEPETPGEFSYRDELRRQPGWRGWLARRRWVPLRMIETDLAWAAFIVFTALTMLSHNTALLFPLAANIFVLGWLAVQKVRQPRPPASATAQSGWLANWLKAQAAVFLLWSPWLAGFLQQARRVDQATWIPQPGWDAVFQALQVFVNAAAPGQTSPIQRLGWVLFALALGLGVVHFRKNPARMLFLAGMFALPLLGELLVSLRQPVFLDRTLIWVTIPLTLALAAGIAQLKQRLLMIAAVGVLSAFNLFAAADFYRAPQSEDWRSPAGYIAYFVEKGDLILFNAPTVQIPFDTYFKPYERQYGLQVERRGVPVELSESGILEPKMTPGDLPRLAALLEGRRRVWLVYGMTWNTDPAGLIPQALGERLHVRQERAYRGVLVRLYAAP